MTKRKEPSIFSQKRLCFLVVSGLAISGRIAAQPVSQLSGGELHGRRDHSPSNGAQRGEATVRREETDTYGSSAARTNPRILRRREYQRASFTSDSSDVRSAESHNVCGTTDDQRELEIRSIFTRISHIAPDTPQEDALRWLIHDDELFLCSSDPAIIERFAIVTIVYATAFENWKDSGNVLSGAGVCEWRGEPDGKGSPSFAIICDDNGVVESLDLDKNNLGGTIPTEIGLLSGLRLINAGGNNIGGTIPKSIWQLVRLETINLGDNKITGTLPDELFSLPRLKELSMHTNLLEKMVPKIEP
uniref:Leucine-rich repeat-containing N-terminal plant-type domain-containing protein n=1 Tax=Corethron hystrix TaxID=216773 RepID=A0A7S1FXT0_9STRA|mmetsp:Transcript_40480/g.95088  ORF Transcript_40480/g.95088 Transcript_40480/m.95088 type:complete len:303 (+) Transcript_40480:69-977(+)